MAEVDWEEASVEMTTEDASCAWAVPAAPSSPRTRTTSIRPNDLPRCCISLGNSIGDKIDVIRSFSESPDSEGK
jgi:hypothetical protein